MNNDDDKIIEFSTKRFGSRGTEVTKLPEGKPLETTKSIEIDFHDKGRKLVLTDMGEYVICKFQYVSATIPKESIKEVILALQEIER